MSFEVGRVEYDAFSDVLHVTFVSERRAYGDEYGHVTLMRDMSTDEITGLIIFSPKRKQEEVINDLKRVENETGFIFNLDDIKDIWRDGKNVKFFVPDRSKFDIRRVRVVKRIRGIKKPFEYYIKYYIKNFNDYKLFTEEFDVSLSDIEKDDDWVELVFYSNEKKEIVITA